MSTVIDKAFWGSAKMETDLEKNDPSTSYVTNCANLSSNPSLLLFLDFLVSVIYLIIVIYFCFRDDGSFLEGKLYFFLTSLISLLELTVFFFFY